MSEATGLPVRPENFEMLQDLVGKDIGPAEWHDVTQERVNAFADATGDHQWIHVDPVKAASSGLGGTIAHGLYSLAMGPAFSYSLLSLDAFPHLLNYGYDKVRFPAPLPVGSRLRMTMRVTSVERVTGGIQLRAVNTFECEGLEKPVCVAESLSRVVEA